MLTELLDRTSSSLGPRGRVSVSTPRLDFFDPLARRHDQGVAEVDEQSRFQDTDDALQSTIERAGVIDLCKTAIDDGVASVREEWRSVGLSAAGGRRSQFTKSQLRVRDANRANFDRNWSRLSQTLYTFVGCDHRHAVPGRTGHKLLAQAAPRHVL